MEDLELLEWNWVLAEVRESIWVNMDLFSSLLFATSLKKQSKILASFLITLPDLEKI